MDEMVYSEVSKKNYSNIKQLYWDIAIGLQRVDNLIPSKFLFGLVKEYLENKISLYEIEDIIEKNYILNEITEEEYECDLVSTRIVKLLQDNEFELSNAFFQKIHRVLFNKIYGFAGKYRQVNISKSEEILEGDTVQYQPYDLIEETLKYDFNEEKDIDYSSFSKKELIDRITEFTSRIWQVHPFQEGNTRTTAVFIQKYLISMGFNINNELFKDNALYFRNSLVRANYTNYSVGVKETKQYLNKFFENLLLNKNNDLNNDDLKI